MGKNKNSSIRVHILNIKKVIRVYILNMEKKHPLINNIYNPC